jgi:K+-sensing histidine kinase KdpD
VVLVDELAHTNIPGSKNRKRYEDVQAILAAKIDVISTLNIQHIESISPVVRNITGITIRETVPDWVPMTATETVMVDLTPEALQNRMRRGDVYLPTKVEQALNNFFRRGNLIALRELALRQVAEQVDRSLENYMAAKDIQKNWAVRERIAVCVSSNPTAQYLIAAPPAWPAVSIPSCMSFMWTPARQFRREPENPAANLRFAENLGAKVVQLKGLSVADTVAKSCAKSTSRTSSSAVRSNTAGANTSISLPPTASFANPRKSTSTSSPRKKTELGRGFARYRDRRLPYSLTPRRPKRCYRQLRFLGEKQPSPLRSSASKAVRRPA